MKILGGFLISLPFIGINVMCCYAMGYKIPLISTGIVIAIAGVVMAGVYCLLKEK